jgi:gluconate kinase
MTKVVLLTGPPGAGKSTVSEAFTAQAAGTWAYVEQDEIRKQVRTGYADPSQPWTDETQAQWDASIGICADMARRYQGIGVNSLIDCSMSSRRVPKWEQTFTGISYQVMVLLPDVEVALVRNNQRSGAARLTETQVREQYEWYETYRDDEGVTVIDSSELTVNGLVQALTVAIN